MLDETFKVGNRVRIVNYNSERDGLIGTVVREINLNGYIGVCHDAKNVYFHDCDGLCKHENGWFYSKENIELISNKKDFNLGDCVKITKTISSYLSKTGTISSIYLDGLSHKYSVNDNYYLAEDLELWNPEPTLNTLKYGEIIKSNNGGETMAEETDFKWLIQKKMSLIEKKNFIKLNQTNHDTEIICKEKLIKDTMKEIEELQKVKLQDSALIDEQIKELDQYLASYKAK